RAVKRRLEARAKLASFVARIRETFPDLKFSRAKLFDEGHDNSAVILDATWVFRFPKHEASRISFPYELRLLEALKQNTSVAVPDYRYVAPGSAFGGYRMLPGDVMRPSRFQALGRTDQEAVLLQIADLLSAIHALPPALLQRPDGSIPSYWVDPRFSHGWFQERKELFASVVDPDLVDAMARFYELPSPKDPPSKLIHGDIQENHILLPKGGRQIGVIDFDLRLGAPAWDFGALWAWGDWAPRFVFQHYAFAAEDPDLLERSRLQSVRYWVERLYWRIQGADTHL